MKKRLIILLLSLYEFSAGCGYKIPCDQVIQTTKQQNIQILQNAYNNLNASMDTMFDLENQYKEKLIEQNELLLKLEKLEIESLTNEKNLLLLMKQNNQILDKIIDIDLTEKIDEISKGN
jgi:hypothetical protein